MKKALFLLMTLGLVAGCGNVTPPENSPKIVSFLADFMEAHPNWDQNQVIKKQTLETLRSGLEFRLKYGYLDSIPLRLVAVKEIEPGSFYATLDRLACAGDFKKNGNKYDLYFSVVGSIDNSLVNRLQEGSSYYIKGNFIRTLSEELPEISTLSIPYTTREDGTHYTFYLGDMLFDIKEMIPVEKSYY